MRRAESESSIGEWSALQVQLQWIYEGPVVASARNFQVQGAPSYSAWLLLAGTAEVQSGARFLKAKAGQWLLPMPAPRRQRFSGNAKILSINMQLSWPSGEPLFSREFGFAFPARKFPALERAARRLLRVACRRVPHGAAEYWRHPATLEAYLRLQQQFPAWVETFVRVVQSLGCSMAPRGTADERLLRAMNVLKASLLGESGSRKAAAEAAGLSLSQLDRLFTAHFGLTPRAFLDRRKIEAARAELETSRRPIKEIAWRLGFRQANHFAAWFRQRVGKTPREFRRPCSDHLR